MQIALIMGLAALAATQDVGTISPGGIEAIGPKQDDPRAMCDPGSEPMAGMLSQGRVRLSTSSGIRPSPGGKLAIGPKQDDPRAPGVLARPGDDNDPKASGGSGIIVEGGLEAIGPKQDDPRAMCGPDGTATTGMLDAGRVRTSSSSGMKPTPGGMLAIGPKQDDPSRPGALARPGDDNDPKASGGSGIIVQGGIEAIGPKQDDPRSPALAIGPKQDDPRAPGVMARPGDDEDPQALAMAGKCGAAAR